MLHFCSVDDVQASITPSGGRFDTLYRTCRDSATDEINQYMRRTFDAFTGKTRVFGTHGRGPQSWYLGDVNINPATFSLLYASDLDFVTNPVMLVPGVDYDLDPVSSKVRVWPEYHVRAGSYKATWDGGYAVDPANGADYFASPPLPGSLKRAAIMQAQWWFQKLSTQTTGNQQDTKNKTPINRVRLVDGLLPDVASAVSRYRVNLSR